MSPYLSVPLLAGQLGAAGFEADALDLNVRFYNHILEKNHLASCLERARDIHARLCKTVCEKYPDAEKLFPSLSTGEQTLLLRHRKLGELLSCGEDWQAVIDGVESAVNVMRSKTDFYDAEKLFDAKMLLQQALKIASMPYAPNELIWDNYFANPLLKMDWVNIASQCEDSTVNMYIDFFEEYAQKINAGGYDLIAISVPDLSQIIGAFTLSRILKEKTNAHICVGGNYITQNKADFLNHPEIFGKYVSSLMTGDGETAIVSMARFIAGEIPESEVEGIVFKLSDGTLRCGGEAPRLEMNSVAYACFDDYDLSAYYSPEKVFPFQLGKGCYWGKCAFCDYYYGQQCFDIKTPERAVEELRYYSEKYGAHHFMFVDEAVPPAYYDKLSAAILRSGLKVWYYSFARLENGFTPEVLSRMHSAGCRMLLWGYECHSERVMKMMNKGIRPETRLDIMRASHEAGIWNNALFIIGYPTEKPEEIDDTLNVIKKNRDIINSCTPSNFSLKKNALITSCVGKDGVISCETNGEFYTVCKDKIIGISQEERREIRRGFHFDFITENRHCLWPVVYSDFDHILLYLAKYGLEYVQNYRSGRNICPMFR